MEEEVMWPFKKKYIYKVEWAYNPTSLAYTEFIKATDVADAWHQIAKAHGAIDCRGIEKIEE
jgi:hypothetical protein